MMTPEERAYLRELAKEQLELHHSKEQEERRRQHWALNTKISGTRPTFMIEAKPFEKEFIPKEAYRCEDPYAKRIEAQLLYEIYHQKIIGDDRLIPGTYQMGWRIHVDEFGFPITSHSVLSSGQRQGMYRIDYAIEDIEADFHKLSPLKATVDREYTQAYRTAVEESIGDILPVEMTGWPALVLFLTRSLVSLMGIENYYYALVDQPDQVHRLMEYLLGNAFLLMDFFEKEKIMYVNNGEIDLWNSTYPCTDKLPAKDYQGVARMKDMYLRTDSQETVSISPEMFCEFCLPYYQRLCARGGLWYYGCCEPVHPIWDCALSKIPNIKKLSISKWCDERIMGEKLRNTGIVYSKKLDATYLGVGDLCDERGLRKSIKDTMSLAGGNQIEFIARDILTINNRPEKLRQAVRAVREEIADALGG